MKKNPWVLLLVIYLASIYVVMAEYKVPPVIPTLIEELGLSMVAAGLSMSIFCFTAIVLAFPSALILQRWGARLTGMFAIGCTAVGSLLGIMAPSFPIFLLSRIVEGIGMGLIAVMAPAVIAMIFPQEKRGLAMGIWASWFPFGISVIFFLAPTIQAAFGRLGLWWFTALLGIAVMALYGKVMPDLGKDANGVREKGQTPQKGRSLAALKSPALWLLAVAFLAFNLVQLGYVNWGPTYLIEALGFDPGKANYYFSMLNIISCIGTVTSGLIIVKFYQHTKRIMLSVLFLLTITFGFAFNLTESTAIVIMVLVGLLTSCVATLVWTMTPDTVPKEYTGLAVAIMIIFQNVGDLAGPPTIGGLVQQTGNWSLGSVFFVASLVVSILCIVFYRKPKSYDPIRPSEEGQNYGEGVAL